MIGRVGRFLGDGSGKKFFRGGLIASWRDNYSIIHTRLLENKKEWNLRLWKKSSGIYEPLPFVLVVGLKGCSSRRNYLVICRLSWEHDLATILGNFSQLGISILSTAVNDLGISNLYLLLFL